MSASRTLEYHHSVSRVAKWCAWYTRGLAPTVAAARREEIASDLYEHGAYADEIGLTPRRLSRTILLRAVLGVSADLSWRRSQARAIPTAEGALARSLARGRLPVLTYLISAVLFVWGGFVLTRVAVAMMRSEWWAQSDLAASVVLSSVVCGCGLLLLRRARTRSIGALWLMFAVYGLVRYGGKALVHVSATYSHLFFTVPGWNTLNLGVIAGLMLFFLAMAIWWWPSGPARTTAATAGPLDLSASVNGVNTA